jgi:uncharacterized protein DUF6328
MPTQLPQKLKTALDETRMLILGAQILFGFQLRGAFSDGYDRLPGHWRLLDGLALGLLLCTVALLIAPGPYHRIAEGGDDSGRLHAVVTGIAEAALLPFALALGIDLFLTSERIVGVTGAVIAGTATSLVALGFWYGLPRAKRRHTGKEERAMTRSHADERSTPPLHAGIEQLLTEARVILPGVQALFGFQLAIVLTQPFEKLPTASKLVHGASLCLAALAIVLLMAPAAYHRIVFDGEEAPEVHRVGSLLVTVGTVPLAFALAGDIYVVIAKIAASPTIGIVAAALALILLLGLWYAYPLAARTAR